MLTAVTLLIQFNFLAIIVQKVLVLILCLHNFERGNAAFKIVDYLVAIEPHCRCCRGVALLRLVHFATHV